MFTISYNMEFPWSVNVEFICFELCLRKLQVLLYTGQRHFIYEVIMSKKLLAVHHPVEYNAINLGIC